MSEDVGKAVMDAMTRYYIARQGSEFLGGTVVNRLFPSAYEQTGGLLTRLEIVKKKRELGLPVSTEEYENLINDGGEDRFVNPGRGLTLGSVALSSGKPLLKLGQSPILKGMKHGRLGTAVGAIGKFFGG